MIPSYLVDTNIHLRIAQPASPDHAAARQAVALLLQEGADLVVALQNLVEFWAVATRPTAARGGLGLDHTRARAELAQIVSLFRLLPDSAGVFPRWLALLDSPGALGIQAHEARLVATMQEHGMTHILTFNTPDFVRYSGIFAVHPSSVPTL